MKDRLWPAGAVAFAMHSFVITALALNMIPSKVGSLQIVKDKFCVEMVFDQATPVSFDSPCEHSEAMTRDENSQESKQVEKASPNNDEKPLSKMVQKRRAEDKQALVSPLTSTLMASEANSSQPLFNPPPIYPREARRRKIQGVVMVRASLSEEGAVAGAITLAPRMDPILEDAALRAIHQWRFKPGVRTVEVPIEFKLVV